MRMSYSFALLSVILCAYFPFLQARSLHPREEDDEEVEVNEEDYDHSDIKHWAALGDSFAAGIGAGKSIDRDCSRYDQAYPAVINDNEDVWRKKDDRKFEFLACSGAKTEDVLKKQIPMLQDASLDMATLSISGNDIGLKDILNACIFQWNTGIPPKGSEYCDEVLTTAKKNIDGKELSTSLDNILKDLSKKMKSKDAKIYWTSYANFFSTETDECDKVTWAFKFNIKASQYLTKARRQKMNDLTGALHKKLREAIERFGDQAIWVPWDGAVNLMEGHYCEPGVDENNGKDRETLIFYEWGSTLDEKQDDDLKVGLKKRDDHPSADSDSDKSPTFQSDISKFMQDAIKDGLAKPEDFGMEPHEQPPGKDEADKNEGNGKENDKKQLSLVQWLIPDKYGRIFHPQKYGHLIIAEAVFRAMDNAKARARGAKMAVGSAIITEYPTGKASPLGEVDVCYIDRKDQKQPRDIKFDVEDAKRAWVAFCLSHTGETVPRGDGIVDRKPLGVDDGRDKFTGNSFELAVKLNEADYCKDYPSKDILAYYPCINRFELGSEGCKSFPPLLPSLLNPVPVFLIYTAFTLHVISIISIVIHPYIPRSAY